MSFMDLAELGAIDRAIDLALDEDLASGDVTTRCCVPASASARAAILARGATIACGGEIARRVFHRVDPRLAVEGRVGEGVQVEAGTTLMTIAGAARSILAAERVALNLLQRACGVATVTAQHVAVAGGRVRVCDTRKTMPGLRALDRYAVRRGGGHNHRNDLGAGVLIKENHIRAAGSLEAAIAGAIAGAPHGMLVQCEVRELEEVERALVAGARALLLDNMDDERVAAAVALVRARAGASVVIEVSGGMTRERLAELSRLAIDVVSVGALTHSVVAADLSLLFEIDT